MFTDMEKRGYTLKKRAESQEATRERIVEAVMQLHEELGPRNASISAIADRAGVQRLTVYRHFPDETALFQACTSRWLALNPPPAPEGWSDIPDAAERCRAALMALYTYYRGTERMWIASYRDVGEVPALQAPMAQFEGYLDSIATGLRQAFGTDGKIGDLGGKDGGRGGTDGKDALALTLRHAVRFGTWRSLATMRLEDEESADLAMRWIDGSRQPSSDTVPGCPPGRPRL